MMPRVQLVPDGEYIPLSAGPAKHSSMVDSTVLNKHGGSQSWHHHLLDRVIQHSSTIWDDVTITKNIFLP